MNILFKLRNSQKIALRATLTLISIQNWVMQSAGLVISNISGDQLRTAWAGAVMLDYPM